MREFALREIAPYVAAYDQEERFPIEIVKKAAAQGYLGGVIPVEYGGAGLDHVTYTLLIEEIARKRWQKVHCLHQESGWPLFSRAWSEMGISSASARGVGR